MTVIHLPGLVGGSIRQPAARVDVDIHAIERGLLASLERGDARSAVIVGRLLDAMQLVPEPARRTR